MKDVLGGSTKGIFFTADTHFGHENIMRHCNRPFDNIEEHDATLINNWNNVVKKGDRVYHLGDFCFKSKNRIEEITDQLNGQIYLINGNHDKDVERSADCFVWIKDYFELNVLHKTYKQKICLFHYACRVWNSSHYDSWQLYGHSHGSLKDDEHAKSFDVGVDVHKFTPISYEQVIEIMNHKKPFKVVDHHNREDE